MRGAYFFEEALIYLGIISPRGVFFLNVFHYYFLLWTLEQAYFGVLFFRTESAIRILSLCKIFERKEEEMWERGRWFHRN